MSTRDYRDVLGGLAMVVIGLFFAVYGWRYEVGTLFRMGPGFFPVVLGFVLAGLGLIIAIPGWLRSGTAPVIQWRTLLLVTGGTLLFAVLLRSVGVVISTFITVYIFTLADREISWWGRFAVAVAVTLIVVLIFVVGLNMRLPLWWGG